MKKHQIICTTRRGDITFLANEQQSLMQQIQKLLPVASSCYGEGICTKCKMKILSGQAANLSPLTDFEYRALKNGQISAHERLSCQTYPRGHCQVSTTYW